MGIIEGIGIGNAASSSIVMMLAMGAGIAPGISEGTMTTGSNGIGTGTTIATGTTDSASSILITTRSERVITGTIVVATVATSSEIVVGKTLLGGFEPLREGNWDC